ncbi:hypothetical protein [Paenibacillus sp. FSL R5-0810]|uniref:hypothetical protein n=1 Tax=Paenibacillus sp. FSL R5-0810 TaxID=2921659 RepID=UPI0030F7CE07
MSKKMAFLTLTTLLAFGFFTGCDDPKGGDSSSGNQRSPQDKAGREAQLDGQGEHGAHEAEEASAHGIQDVQEPHEARGSHRTSEAHGTHTANASHGAHAGHGAHAEHGAGHGVSSDDYKAAFQFNGALNAGSDTELTIKITNKDGQPVQQFDVNHEKLMHLIIVNHDLSYFEHIHPDYLENGVFTVNTTFPAGGKYKLFADFVPQGAHGATLSEWVTVAGEEQAHAPIKPTNLVQQVDGKRVELSLSNTLSNEEAVLAFEFQDAETKQGIDNLEPYLGAIGHVVILSADAEEYIHVHPVDEDGTGPKAEFATIFPNSGIYKIWGQFQHKNEVFTTAFVVEIQ